MAWQQARFIAIGESLEHLHEIRESALSFVAGHSVAELVRDRRGGLRRGHRRQDLARHPRPGPAAPGRRPAGLARDGDPGRGGRRDRAAARAVRRTRHGRRERRRGLHRPAGRGAAARPGQGRRRPRPGRAGGAGPGRAARPTPTRPTTSRCSPWSGEPCAINPDAALRAHAKANGWRVRDYRTGRKAAKVGVPGRRRGRGGGRRGLRRAALAAPAPPPALGAAPDARLSGAPARGR